MTSPSPGTSPMPAAAFTRGAGRGSGQPRNCAGTEGAAIGRGRGPHGLAEVVPVGDGGVEADRAGDLLNGRAGGFEQGQTGLDALADEPPDRAGAGGAGEVPQVGALGYVRLLCQGPDGDGLGEVFQRPGHA